MSASGWVGWRLWPVSTITLFVLHLMACVWAAVGKADGDTWFDQYLYLDFEDATSGPNTTQGQHYLGQHCLA